MNIENLNNKYPQIFFNDPIKTHSSPKYLHIKFYLLTWVAQFIHLRNPIYIYNSYKQTYELEVIHGEYHIFKTKHYIQSCNNKFTRNKISRPTTDLRLYQAYIHIHLGDERDSHHMNLVQISYFLYNIYMRLLVH